MAVVHFVRKVPAADGVLVPAKGGLRFTPTARRVIVGAPDVVVLPASFSVQLVNGAADVTLEPTTGAWVWRVDEYCTGTPARTTHVAVPAVAELDDTDLVVVDPATLEPSAAPEPAWVAMAQSTVTTGTVTGDNLILTRTDGTTFNAGAVRGADGTDATVTPESVSANLPERLSETTLTSTFVRVSATAPDPAQIPAYVDTSTTPATLKVWDGAAWVTASGSGGAAATNVLRQIADRSRVSTLSTVTTTGNQSKTNKTKHTIHMEATNPQLVFGNIEVSGGVQVYGANAYTVAAALEIAGTLRPLTFGGQGTAAVAPGSFVTSDPLEGVTLHAGQEVYVRTYYSVATVGQKYPKTAGDSLQSARSEGFVYLQNLTTAGSGQVTAVTSAEGTFPLSFLGSVTPSAGVAIAAIGDSICEGQKDTFWGGVNTGGYIDRALTAANLAWINFAHGGDAFYKLNTQAERDARFGPGLEACTHVICEYGVNDFYNAGSLASIQVDAINLWNYIRDRVGAVIWQTTLSPYATSTDSWATVTNQILQYPTKEGFRTGFNNWVRDGAPILNGVAVATGSSAAGTLRAGQSGHPLKGYFEIADRAESARDSGFWKATGRSVNDLATTSGSATVTSATANFTAADVGKAVYINGGAGKTAGTTISSVTNSTTAVVANAPTFTGTGMILGININGYTSDGLHPSPLAYSEMALGINASVFTV